MARRAGTTTARTDCEHGCGTRVIIARRVPHPLTGAPGKGWLPALDFGEDPAGNVAVRHLASGGYTGFFLAAGEGLPGPEWARRAVHECGETRRHAQRGRWAQAIGDLHAAQRGRGRRAAPGPDMAPGMGRIPRHEPPDESTLL